MSENINLQPTPLYANPEVQFSASQEAYKTYLDQQVLPEVFDNRPAIEEAGKNLINDYDLQPSLFEDPTRGLLFTAIASRLSKVEGDAKEHIFIEDALTLVAHEHSPKLKEVYDYARSFQPNDSDKFQLVVYDKYTDQQMTTELKQAIDDGLLQGVKDRLGITADNEDKYEVRVLSIGDLMATFGMDAPKFPDINPFKNGKLDSQKQRQLDEILELHDAAKEWKEGLEKRQEAFSDELDGTAVAGAWVTRMEGKTFLCVKAPTIEKILHPETTLNNPYYNEGAYHKDDIATLEHEYVHTQGGVNVDRGINLGIGLEELRAEEYSGNRQGYSDMKNFAADFGILTGTHLIDYLKRAPKGGDSLQAYTAIASNVGLDRMLEVVLVRPDAYDRNQPNIINEMIADHLGGFDSLAARILEDQIAAGKKEQFEERLNQRAQRLIEAADQEFLPTYFSMRRHHGNKLITDMLETRVQQLKAASTPVS